MVTNKASSAELVVKPLQWVEETVEGATPNTGTVTAVGISAMISVKKGNQFVDVPQLSMEDLAGLVAGQRKYQFQIKYNPINSTFLKYGINSANYASPSGTISTPLCLIISVYFNGVENYIIINGLRIDKTQVDEEVGKPVQITMDCLGMFINAPTATAPTGLTLVTATPVGPAWDWLSGGTNPVTDGATGQDCKKFSISVSRNVKEEYTLGNNDPFGLLPHARKVTFSGDFIWDSTGTFEADRDSKTAKTMTAVLKTTLSTITLSNAYIDQYQRDIDIGSGQAIIESITGKALTIAVT